jgi:hypothetical protein
MTSPRTVPLLPCGSIDQAAQFGVAIGFEVSYQQGDPHPYLALRSPDGIELHYFEVPLFDPSTSHGSCLVIVADPVEVLATWSAGLGRLYGTVPVTGIPRLLRPTARTSTEAFMGFSLVDVGGNRIRVVRDATARSEASDATQADVVVVPTPVPKAAPQPEPAPAAAPRPEPEPEPVPEPEPEPEPAPTLAPRPSAFERHGVAAAPKHRLSALVYLAELAVGLGRLDDARAHLEAAETIDASAPSVVALRATLDESRRSADESRRSADESLGDPGS